MLFSFLCWRLSTGSDSVVALRGSSQVWKCYLLGNYQKSMDLKKLGVFFAKRSQVNEWSKQILTANSQSFSILMWKPFSFSRALSREALNAPAIERDQGNSPKLKLTTQLKPWPFKHFWHFGNKGIWILDSADKSNLWSENSRAGFVDF